MTIPTLNDDFVRLPGLFRSWDFGLLLEEGCSYLIEGGGRTDDGQALYMVFHCQKPFDGAVARHEG